MERDAVRVAGFGFRKGAGVESLLAALEAAGGAEGVGRITTVVDKAGAEVFQALADRLGLPVEAVPREALRWVAVETQSEKSEAMYGTGSLSEATALIAAGPKARLLAARAISPDSLATCAIAETFQ
jgi:cobalt-precorrin 5A hydrolase